MLTKLIVGVCALALVNGATASLPSVTWRGRTGTYEKGFCVDSRGRDVNHKVVKLDGNNYFPFAVRRQKSCALRCLDIPGTFGAEVIWSQGNRGCYCHKAHEVAKGNKVARHRCMIFKGALSPSQRFGTGKKTDYGTRSHNSLMGHVKQIEKELKIEMKDTLAKGRSECTDNAAANVRLVQHVFANKKRQHGIVGCRANSRCGRWSSKNIDTMKIKATCEINRKNLIDSNNYKIRDNNAKITASRKKVAHAKKASRKRTGVYTVDKASHAHAEKVLRHIRTRLKRDGTLVFTEEEQKVLGLGLIQVLEETKRAKQRGSVNRLINLIEKLIRDFKSKQALLDKAEKIQLSETKARVTILSSDISRRAGQNRVLIASNTRASTAQRACQKAFNNLNKAMRTLPKNCLASHKIFKATITDIKRELGVIVEIKALVNKGRLKNIKG